MDKPIKGKFGYDVSNSIANIQQQQQQQQKGKTNDGESVMSTLCNNKYKNQVDNQKWDNNHQNLVKPKGSEKAQMIEDSVNNETETVNDADDEKDSISTTTNSVTFSDFGFDDDSELKYKKSIPIRTNLEFENITKCLLQQLEMSKEDAKQNRKLAQKFEKELNIVNKNLKTRKIENIEDSVYNFNNIINYYTTKIDELDNKIRSDGSYVIELENTFNEIQLFQSEIYQKNLRDLQSQLKLKESQIEKLKNDYSQLEEWVLTLFKEIGERSKTWNNKEFILSIRDISKCLKQPVKESNLVMVYKYLIQFLYSEDQPLSEVNLLK